MLNLFIMVLDHIYSILHDLRPDIGAGKAWPPPHFGIYGAPTETEYFWAKLSVSVVQIQQLCDPYSLCRVSKGDEFIYDGLRLYEILFDVI